MTEVDLRQLLISTFSALRRSANGLGIGELLAALQMVEADYEVNGPNNFREDIRLLWCGGNSDWRARSEFEDAWGAALTSVLVAEPSSGDTSVESLLEAPSIESTVLESGESDNTREILQSAPQFNPVETAKKDTLEEESEEVPTSQSLQEDNAQETSPPQTGPHSNHRETSKPRVMPQGIPRRRVGRLSTEPPPVYKAGSKALSPTLSALPVPVPFNPISLGTSVEVHAYWPISRLSMAYAWRYLRRPLPDGPADILDIEATVGRVARQGFFLTPVYRRRQSNHAQLILLIDQGGSMLPFQHITHDLVETALLESTVKQLDTFYFHNVLFADGAYSDPYLINPVDLHQTLDRCTPDTSVLIVSDAGAARGNCRLPRIRGTAQMLFRLKQQTNLLAWINPMPKPRWLGTSAETIAEMVPMFQMDSDGFSSAIDALRGADSPFAPFK